MRISTKELEKINEKATALKSELEQLKREVSEIRKRGKYTRFIEPLLFEAWPKIRMYNATGSQKDLDEVMTLYQQIRDEIEKLKNSEDNSS
jgi:prefoldin subunit 5